MTDGNTYVINKYLNDQEDWDALQEVTAELEQAEAETKKYHDAILDDFAMEDPIAPETLRTYIGKYPSLAVELTDLYHELLLVDQTAAADGIELEQAEARIEELEAALEGKAQDLTECAVCVYEIGPYGAAVKRSPSNK